MKCSSFIYLILFLILLVEFKDDPDLYMLKPIKYVGIEVWQVGFHMFNCSTEDHIQIFTSMKKNVEHQVNGAKNHFDEGRSNFYDTVKCFQIKYQPTRALTL